MVPGGASQVSDQWNSTDSLKYLHAPKANDHKYSRGVLGCITGSRKFPGAAILSTESALNMGIGMVRFFGPPVLKRAVIQKRPEVVISNGRVDAYLIGSGIPNQHSFMREYQFKKAVQSHLPLVLDAGALHLAGKSSAPTIITPHAAELSNLIGVSIAGINSDPEHYAKEAAQKFDITVLLKGHETWLVNPKRSIKMPAATSWLATAGTGDVLAGILGALLASNHGNVTHENLIEIGATAVLIHSRIAENVSGGGPVTPTLMINEISNVIRTLLT